ncbi:hypothetical protein K438DRAFT_2087455 [Mycena galopus ATCC 62051]|nr:hypothetical protein K438DRAFT_2087455 [Mycena galopus ATCC 62051]
MDREARQLGVRMVYSQVTTGGPSRKSLVTAANKPINCTHRVEEGKTFHKRKWTADLAVRNSQGAMLSDSIGKYYGQVQESHRQAEQSAEKRNAERWTSMEWRFSPRCCLGDYRLAQMGSLVLGMPAQLDGLVQTGATHVKRVAQQGIAKIPDPRFKVATFWFLFEFFLRSFLNTFGAKMAKRWPSRRSNRKSNRTSLNATTVLLIRLQPFSFVYEGPYSL